MRTMTICQVWFRNINECEPGIYLIRDGETALYVGRSLHPLKRLHQHLFSESYWRGGGSRKLRKLLEEHMRETRNWVVEVFNLDDCATFVAQYRPDHYEWLQSQRVGEHYGACVGLEPKIGIGM